MTEYLIVGQLIQQNINKFMNVHGLKTITLIPDGKTMFNFLYHELDESDKVYYPSPGLAKVYNKGYIPTPPFTLATMRGGEQAILFHRRGYPIARIEGSVEAFLEAYTSPLRFDRKGYTLYRIPLTNYNTMLRISNSFPEMMLGMGIDDVTLGSVTTREVFAIEDGDETLVKRKSLNTMARIESAEFMGALALIVSYKGELYGFKKPARGKNYIVFKLKERILNVSNVRDPRTF